MKIIECHNFRIRGTADLNVDVEKFIKSVEKHFNVDIRSLPQWKEIIGRLHVSTTEYQQKVQDMNLRKAMIVDRLYIQNTRVSPFEMTDQLARTAELWKKPRVKATQDIATSPMTSNTSKTSVSGEILGEISDHILNNTVPPNTEIATSPHDENVSDKITMVFEETNADSVPVLPPVIFTNPHRILSPLASKATRLSYKPPSLPQQTRVESVDRLEWMIFPKNNSILTNPKQITIDNLSLEEQVINFSLKNCTMEYLFVIFKDYTNRIPFRYAEVCPDTSFKLYPGLPVSFKLRFRLAQNEQDFNSGLYFKVGHNSLLDAPYEALLIPIESLFNKKRVVSVPRTVSIPPIYLWQLSENAYPRGLVKIAIGDNHYYHLNIVKRSEKDDSTETMPESEESESSAYIERNDNANNDFDSKPKTSTVAFSPRGKNSTVAVNDTENVPVEKTSSILLQESIQSIIEDIINMTLDVFIFEKTYLYLSPFSTTVIEVNFTKAEHIGYHNAVYDFIFTDPITNQTVATRTTRLFAEVYAHPLKITPLILDMSSAPVKYGFCQDYFYISNSNKLYPAAIKIMLTKKQRRMFRIKPLEISVRPQSSERFEVMFCSHDPAPDGTSESDQYVHVTIKIIANGYRPIYANIPPMFYEIIVPCAKIFKKIYNKKFFDDRNSEELQPTSV